MAERMRPAISVGLHSGQAGSGWLARLGVLGRTLRPSAKRRKILPAVRLSEFDGLRAGHR
jgi:hypothetical protein